MKNPEMLKFVSDYFETKKMCKYAIKRLPSLLRYVPDQYKAQQLCDKVMLENDGTLKSASNGYKNKEMFNEAVAIYSHVLELLPEYYKKSVIKMLILTFLQQNLFLNAIRP